MTPGEIILALVGFALTALGTVAVFRRGAGDAIDRKRESEIKRLDDRLVKVEDDLHLVAGVAYRAVRHIEDETGKRFALTKDEIDALERTRPI